MVVVDRAVVEEVVVVTNHNLIQPEGVTAFPAGRLLNGSPLCFFSGDGRDSRQPGGSRPLVCRNW